MCHVCDLAWSIDSNSLVTRDDLGISWNSMRTEPPLVGLPLSGLKRDVYFHPFHPRDFSGFHLYLCVILCDHYFVNFNNSPTCNILTLIPVQWGSYELCRFDMHIVHVKIHLVNIQHPTLTYWYHTSYSSHIHPTSAPFRGSPWQHYIHRGGHSALRAWKFRCCRKCPWLCGRNGSKSSNLYRASFFCMYNVCVYICMYVCMYVCTYDLYIYIIYIGCLILLVYTYGSYKLTGPFTIYTVIYI